MVFDATFNMFKFEVSNNGQLKNFNFLFRNSDHLLCDFLLPDKGVRVMVFNATFNNISVISWLSVLFWWRIREYPEITRPAASH